MKLRNYRGNGGGIIIIILAGGAIIAMVWAGRKWVSWKWHVEDKKRKAAEEDRRRAREEERGGLRMNAFWVEPTPVSDTQPGDSK